MDADGSIVIKTELDDKKAQADLNRLTRKIDTLEKKLQAKSGERNAIAEQLKAANAEAVEAYNNVEKLKNELAKSQKKTDVRSSAKIGPEQYISEIGKQEQIKLQLSQQEQILREKEKNAQRLRAQDEKLVATLERQTQELQEQKVEAGKLSAELAGAKRETNGLSVAAEAAKQRFASIEKRIIGLAKRALVFTVIARALSKVRDYFGEALKGNKEVTAEIAKLKGALLTAAQPILNALVPAFKVLLQVATDVATVIARLFSLFGGSSLEASKDAAESLEKEEAAISGVGGAAKSASKQLAAFDEINKLSEESAGGGGGGASSSYVAPDFSGLTADVKFSLSDIFFDWEDLTAEDILAKLNAALLSIAGLLIGFKVGGLGGAAIGMTVGASLSSLIAKTVFDGDGKLSAGEILHALVDGLIEIGAGIIGFVVGGPFGAAVGVTVGAGITMLLDGLKWGTIGESVKNKFKGIKELLFGDKDKGWEDLTWSLYGTLHADPVLEKILGPEKIADAKKYIERGGTIDKALKYVWEQQVVPWFDQAWLDIKKLAGGVWKEITDTLAEPWIKAYNTLSDVWKDIKQGCSDGWDAIGKWWDETIVSWWNENVKPWFTAEKWSGIWDDVKQGVSDGWLKIKNWWNTTIGAWWNTNVKPWFTKEKWGELWDSVKLGFSEKWTAVEEWWDNSIGGWWDNKVKPWFTKEKWLELLGNVKQAITDKWDEIKTWWNENVAPWFTAAKWEELGKAAFNGLIGIIESGINKVIFGVQDFLNTIFGGLNRIPKVNIELVSWDGVSLPRLAQGAVIPPNREFMAVLGDQKSGTNIETPLATMVQAFRQALSEGGYSGGSEATLVLDRETLGKVVWKLNKAEGNRIGVNLAGV